MSTNHPSFTLTISPDVIRTVVRNTVLATPGVRSFADPHSGRANHRGIQLVVDEKDRSVKLSLHIIAARDAALLELGRHIQQAVREAVEEMLGMHVSQVDIHFEDVTT